MVAKEICAIIKAGGKYGVAHLKLGEVEIFFQGNEKVSEVLPSTDTVIITSPKESVERMSPEAKKEFEEIQTAITDPVAYEQMMMDGDLISERAET
jgi:hypothetical protein